MTRAFVGRGVTLISVVLMFGLCLWQFGDQLSLKALAERESAFREFQIGHPFLVYGAAFLGYVAVTGLSLPGAAGMTLLVGWLFGFWQALVLVSFASTLGASCAFLLARYLMRDAIQARFGDRLKGFNEALSREGAFYLFTMRLIPAVPFFVINVVMGLTPMRLATFWWVSQLGMLPGTAAYVYAGASVPSLNVLAERGAGSILSPQLLTAFVILGLFPVVVRWLFTVAARRKPNGAIAASGDARNLSHQPGRHD